MKTLKSLFIALTVTLTMTASKPSQAAIGAIFSPALVTAGLYIAGGSAAASATGFLATEVIPGCSWDNECGSTTIAIGIYGILGAILGLVILDDEQTVAYTTLSSKEAMKAGLNPFELRGFNTEIDQINALAAFVDTELERMQKPTKEDSANLWREVKDSLSPEAFSGLIKVTNQIYK